jgi:hypothetical protein
MLENFSQGQTVEATFNKKEKYDGSGNFPAICYLYHPYVDWAHVIKIK